MDESVAIYLRFSRDLSNSDEPHDYLCAGRNLRRQSPFVGSRTGRFPALEGKNIELRDDDLHRAVNVIPTSRPYRNVLPTRAPPPPPPPESKRRRDLSARLQGQKRRRGNDSIRDSFDRCFLGATLTFENLPEKLPPRPVTNRPRRQSPDSDGSPSNTPRTSPAKCTPPTTSVTIVCILKRGVAVVTDGRTEFVAKLFPPNPGNTPDKLLVQELAVYAACVTLQGSYIPYLYAVGRVVGSDAFVLLMEFVGCGTTVADIIDELDEADQVDTTELADLQTGAVAALHALHRLKVVHRDVAGRNMVLDEDGGGS